MRDGLWEALETAEADTAILAVIVLGAGPSFGTGGDLREFELEPLPWRNKQIRRERDLWGRLLHQRCLTVALLHGNVAGSGLELALYCDLRLATPDSRWLLPETALGMIPGAGGTQLLPRLARPGRALDLMLRGGPIDGETARRWGLAQDLIGPAAVHQAAPLREPGRQWLAEHVAPLFREGAPVLPLRKLMRRALDMPLAAALEMESRMTSDFA
jgi:enoyl-CoA hydratase/carnithine racemase